MSLDILVLYYMMIVHSALKKILRKHTTHPHKKKHKKKQKGTSINCMVKIIIIRHCVCDVILYQIPLQRKFDHRVHKSKPNRKKPESCILHI